LRSRPQIGNHEDAPGGARRHHGKELQVPDRTESGRPVRNNGVLMERRTQYLLILGIVVITLCCAIGGYMFGLDLTYRELAAVKDRVLQLEPESLRLKRAIVDQNAELVELQSKLATTETALRAILPSENTYSVSPNQSLIVKGTHLTIGLIGLPANDSVNVNINGKQQKMTTGDVIHVALDGSTNCQVSVQSFDMFKAVLTASCAAAKPQ
jgi:hypothetical protein